jgi:hypothetical protein
MIDLEPEVRELLRAKASEGTIPSHPSPRTLRRVRRRQIGNIIAASVLSFALAAGSIVGGQTLFRGRSTMVGGATPGQRTAVLPHTTITYPTSWYLLLLDENTFQLTNFDPAFTEPCFTGDAVPLPTDGIVLVVDRRLGMVDHGAPPWPVTLAENPSPSACPPGGLKSTDPMEPAHLSTGWTIDDGKAVAYEADAVVGPDASNADRAALDEAFASMSFSAIDAPPAESLLGSPALVLDAADSPLGRILLYAYRDKEAWLGVAGPAGSGTAGSAQVPTEPPSGDEDVTMDLRSEGGVVWGNVSDRATRAELRTVEGETFPATLIPLPRSLAANDVQAVWGFVNGPTADRVTTLLFDAQGNVLNTVYPTAPRDVIATGTDPEGGPWTLYVDHSNEGAGLWFAWSNGSGGGGCCFGSLGESDLKLDGYGSGGGDPSHVTAFASTRVAAVDLILDAAARPSETYHAQLFRLADQYMGPAQVVVVIVPAGIPIQGTLVAYDAQGHELAEQPVGDLPEPMGPTVEIDVVWHRLYRARDDLSLASNDDPGLLAKVDAKAAARIDPGVRWNDATVAVPGEVSIRGQGTILHPTTGEVVGSHLVVVSATSSGDAYCVAIEALRDHANNYRYGHVDARGYADCRGGWS